MCVGFLSLRFCTLECWLSGLSGLQVETCFIKQSLNFFLNILEEEEEEKKLE